MRRLLPAGSVVMAAALALPVAGAVAHPAPQRTTTWQLRVSGPATIDRTGTWGAAGTTVLIPAKVRCPAGEHGYGMFAGFPGYFRDGDHAEPSLPAHTMPTPVVECTGKLQRVTFVGRSVHRNQDPATDPYERFHRGRATVVLELMRSDGPPVRATRTIRIRAPKG
jgi:hypothetical protein